MQKLTKKLTLLIFLFANLLVTNQLIAKDLQPNFIYKASGGVTDLFYINKKLYSSTVEGIIDIFDTETKQKIDMIEVPNINSFTGEKVPAKVYSIDILNNKIAMITQAAMGYRRLYIYFDDKLQEVITPKMQLSIVKVKFINETQVLLSLLSNELILFDFVENKIIYKKQVSLSRFSNFAVNKEKTKAVIVDEGANINLTSVQTGEIIKKIKGHNVDNIFQVDYKNNIILAGGKDRRASVVSTSSLKSYYKKAEFFIYAVALSPSGNLAAITDDEDNNVSVFDVNTKQDLYKLGFHKKSVSKILFLNEKELFIASDDNNINYWKLGN